MFTISPNSPIPLHTQLLNELRHAILSGKLKPHEKLPGEYALITELNISRSTVQRAWQTAQEEGLIYRVPAKGTFVAEPTTTSSATKFIGCIVAEFRYTFDGSLLNGADELLRTKGYRLLFAQSERCQEEENHLVYSMCKEGVAGILLWPVAENTQERYITSPSCSVPIVLLDRPVQGAALPCITSQNYDGALQAMNHLLSLGHKSIAFAAWSPLDLMPVAERARAYRDAMVNAGLPPRPVIKLGKPVEAVNYQRYAEEVHEDVAFLAEILGLPDHPTAIFAMNDLLALLVIRAAQQAGLRIPEDLSVVGFDNLELAEHVVPRLTTVHQDTALMGREAVRRLLALIEGDRPQQIYTLLPTRLVIRESTACHVCSSSIPEGGET
jgi:GntR family transcriptional regulator of arabinose operon